jgi:tripartite-type tricarboxylate transporter receptor subunit TctC
VDEAGLPGLYVSTWTAFFAPKGADDAIVNTLSKAARNTLADPVVQKRLADVGQDV